MTQRNGCRMICDVTAHSPTILPLYLRHSSFYSPCVASPTSWALHLRHSLFSNPSLASPTSQVILQPFRCFTYVIGTSPTVCHSSFSNPSVASSTPYLILKPFRRFTNVKSFYNPSVSSPTSQPLHVLHLASRQCIGG